MKRILFAIALTILSFICHSSLAQNDSTYLDLGQMKVQRGFTQSITIKGHDLEKFSFANLSDAVNAWFYGSLSNSSSLVYIVDGNFAYDVNAYSIYEIEEITLVQNALTQLNGPKNDRQLIVITTKRCTTNDSRVSFGTNWSMVEDKTNESILGIPSSLSPPVPKSSLGLFQQHYFSAEKTKEKSSRGISLNYLRDVSPYYNGRIVSENTVPYNMDRIRINSYYNKGLSKGTLLGLYLNYLPQQISNRSEISTIEFKGNTKVKDNQRLFSTCLSLRSANVSGWSNSLNVVYSSFKNNSIEKSYIESIPYSWTRSTLINENKDFVFLLRDDLSYNKEIGNFGITPALNVSLRRGNISRVKERKSDYSTSQGGPIIVDPSSGPFKSSSESSLKHLQITITPSFNFYYKSVFNLQAGALGNFSSLLQKKFKTANPFVSSSIDIIKVVEPSSVNNLKLFVSYATSDVYSDYVNKITDLPTYRAVKTPELLVHNTQYYDTPETVFQVGGVLSFLNERISLDYNYQTRKYLTELWETYRSGAGFEEWWVLYDVHFKIQRLGIKTKVVNDEAFDWTSGISFAKEKYAFRSANFRRTPTTTTGNASMYGGWVNRLTFKSFNIGIDIVYEFNERQTIYSFRDNGWTHENKVFNTIILQNLFLGYQIRNKKNKTLEFYVNSRNLAQSSQAIVEDSRRYYGIGLKMEI